MDDTAVVQPLNTDASEQTPVIAEQGTVTVDGNPISQPIYTYQTPATDTFESGSGSWIITDATNSVLTYAMPNGQVQECVQLVEETLNVRSGSPADLRFEPLWVKGTILLNLSLNLLWKHPEFAVKNGTLLIHVGEDPFCFDIGLIANKWETISIHEPLWLEEETPLRVQFCGDFGEVELGFANLNITGIKGSQVIAKEMPNRIGEYSLEEDNNDGREECLFCDEPLDYVYCEHNKGYYRVCPNCDKKGGRNEDRENGEHSSD